MELVDQDGRLFGLVNVIDALAVLLVAGVVLAGVAVVLQPEPKSPALPETDTVTATLDLGTQPAYLVEQIQPGDTYSPSGNSGLTVTDVYVTPQDGGVRTILGVEVTGPIADSTITYDGALLRLGRDLTIQTDAYQVAGAVHAVGTTPSTSTTPVLLNASIDSTTASTIQVGNAVSLAGRTVATVESVDAYATEDPDRRRALVGLSLRTVDLGNGPQFGDTILRPGAVVPVRTDDYALAGDVRRVGSTEPRGDPATRTVTLEMRNVPPYQSEAIASGTTETVAGTTNARITAVERSPSSLVVTEQDGTVSVRNHTTRETLTLTAELQTRETATGVTFKGRTIQVGSTVVLDLGVVTFEATVTEL